MNPLLHHPTPKASRPAAWNPPSDQADGLDLTRQRDRS
ncbi:MAG: hypothetical protein H6Q28_1629, partial [Bacteroidetes bacterium]|nr:hypothetical protein [Bacteroidota bacterium]